MPAGPSSTLLQVPSFLESDERGRAAAAAGTYWCARRGESAEGGGGASREMARQRRRVRGRRATDGAARPPRRPARAASLGVGLGTEPRAHARRVLGLCDGRPRDRQSRGCRQPRRSRGPEGVFRGVFGLARRVLGRAADEPQVAHQLLLRPSEAEALEVGAHLRLGDLRGGGRLVVGRVVDVEQSGGAVLVLTGVVVVTGVVVARGLAAARGRVVVVRRRLGGVVAGLLRLLQHSPVLEHHLVARLVRQHLLYEPARLVVALRGDAAQHVGDERRRRARHRRRRARHRHGDGAQVPSGVF
mmetsp:Transcript_17400/g.61853  ORF Transcript_17400/g.61853 Transcript_17400/m.61853 type:complete len:301 (+) Transcript_17400:1264-2166(+)